jgi:hypothetical protein
VEYIKEEDHPPAPAARLFGYLSRKGAKNAKDAKGREKGGKVIVCEIIVNRMNHEVQR